MNNIVLLAYVPVIHKGYLDFFHSFVDVADKAFVFGDSLISEFDWLARKDIRKIPPAKSVTALAAIFRGQLSFDVAGLHELGKLNEVPSTLVIMPDEEECHVVAVNHLVHCRTEFVDVFLRYDKKKAVAKLDIKTDAEIPKAGMGDFLGRALMHAGQSPDWWRQVSALVIKDGKILSFAYNKPALSDREHLYVGDPRSLFNKGVNIELSLFEHAEAVCIADAAKNGTQLKGADMFVTTFPCPVCAKMIARSGIERVYFIEGYGMLDAVDILRQKGVEIVRVV